jgi:hypothetical protein
MPLLSNLFIKKSRFYILASLLLISGCATSYTPISHLESIGDAEISNSDFKLTVGIQPLGDNGRFKDQAEKYKITILKLSLLNLSDKSIYVSSKNIYLRGIIDNEPISQFSSHEVADRMSLATGTYWLWGLLWMGYTENNNGQVSSMWLPIGLPIGLINFLRAGSTNKSFENELKENAFPDGDILSNKSKSGMLFFNRAGGVKYNLVVNYIDSTGNKKEISIPYKL